MGPKNRSLRNSQKIWKKSRCRSMKGKWQKESFRIKDLLRCKHPRGSYNALRVVVAIGKTGNARTLGVPGEKLPKVFTRLIDPGEFHDKDILVVGGGDSALEAAIALAKAGNRITLSYRKATLSRPKEQNLAAFEDLVRNGSIVPVFESTVKEIRSGRCGYQGLPTAKGPFPIMSCSLSSARKSRLNFSNAPLSAWKVKNILPTG